MAVDIYTKILGDPMFNGIAVEEESELEIFLQQIDMIFATKKGSLLGDPEFGLSLEQYLWSFSGGSSTIRQEIIQQITEYVEVPEDVDYEIEVSFLRGEIWDSILIDVIVNGSKIAGYYVSP